MKLKTSLILLLLIFSSCSIFKSNKGQAPNEEAAKTTGSQQAVEEDLFEGSETLGNDKGLEMGEANLNSLNATGVGEYTVQKNETLMLISFKLYGDYQKWKNIAAMNKDVNKGIKLIPGTKLKYEVAKNKFSWQPKGSPYLIKIGDTLGRVSNSVYGSTKHWRNIWENNKAMIKNPNLIFAGFTLYYLNKEELVALK